MEIQKEKLLQLPTPIEPLVTDNRNQYYIKRDDLTGFALGGNKARKLEYYLADALAQKADTLVTYGSENSNHCRVVAAAAARYGLDCLIICSTGYKPEYAGNTIMIELLGAEFVSCSVDEVSATVDAVMDKLKADGKTPYYIWGGGHGILGTHAYVECYNELKEGAFDYIFLSSGTGTTQAGLVSGKLLANGREQIVGLSIARKNPYGRQIIWEAVKSYMAFAGHQEPVPLEEIEFCDNYIFGGYAQGDEGVTADIAQMLKDNSIVTDPVYTGKAYSAMKRYIEKHQIAEKRILFLHTGGLPIFFSR